MKDPILAEIERIVSRAENEFVFKLGMIKSEIAKWLQYTNCERAYEGVQDNLIRLNFETSSYGIGFSITVKSDFTPEQLNGSARMELYSRFREIKYNNL